MKGVKGAFKRGATSTRKGAAETSSPDNAVSEQVHDLIERNYKHVDESKKHLETITKKLDVRLTKGDAYVESSKELSGSLGNYAAIVRHFGNPDDSASPTGPGILGDALQVTSQIMKVLELYEHDFHKTIGEQLHVAFSDFLKGEIEAAKREKMNYDRARTAYLNADAKVRKATSGTAVNDQRVFELEKERNQCLDHYRQCSTQTQVTMEDTLTKHYFEGIGKLLKVLEAYQDFHSKAVSAFSDLGAQMTAYRDYVQTQKSTLRRMPRPASSRGALGDTTSAAMSDDNDNPVVKEGFLFKKGEKRRNWSNRWFVLKLGYLYYYNNNIDKKLKGVIHLTQGTEIESNVKRAHSFLIHTPHRSYVLCAKGSSEQKQWMTAVESCKSTSASTTSIGSNTAMNGASTADRSSFTSTSSTHSSPSHTPTPTPPLSREPSAGGVAPSSETLSSLHSRTPSTDAPTPPYKPAALKSPVKALPTLPPKPSPNSGNGRVSPRPVPPRRGKMAPRGKFGARGRGKGPAGGVGGGMRGKYGPMRGRGVAVLAHTLSNSSLSSALSSPSSGPPSSSSSSTASSSAPPPVPTSTAPPPLRSPRSVSPRPNVPRRPGSVTPEAMQRKVELSIKFLNGEKSYVQTLNAIRSYRFNLSKESSAMRALCADGPGGAANADKLFGNIDELFQLHSQLLTSLDDQLSKQSPQIGAALLKLVPDLVVYTKYVANYSTAMNLLTTTKKSSRAFKAFLKTQEQLSMSKLNLSQLLARPLQRTSQISSFLDELVSVTPTRDPDFSHMQLALKKLQKISEEIFQSSTASAGIEQCLRVQKQFSGTEMSDIQLVDAERYVVKEGNLSVLADQNNKTPVHVVLFNDMIFYGAKISSIKKSHHKYKYMGHCEFHRSNLKNIAPNEGAQFAFGVVEKQKTIVFVADSLQEKQEWVTKILDAISEITSTRKVFGVAFADLMKNKRFAALDVPPFIQRATQYLEKHALQVEGIFRISGRQTRIQALKDDINRGKKINLESEDSGVDEHVVAGLLKLWFRELPEPIMTYSLYNSFIRTFEQTNLRAQLEYVKPIISKLPKSNQFLLQHMLQFLKLVAKHEAVNKMNKRNLAIVFAPNILSSENALDMSNLESVYKVMELFMDHYDSLFKDIEAQRRQFNEARLRAQEEQEKKEQLEQDRLNRIIGTRPLSSVNLQSAPSALTSSASGEMLDIERIVKQGYLSKKGGKRRNWNTRWFVLKFKFLGYYAGPQDVMNLPKGKIILTDCKVEKSPGLKFGFSVVCSDRTYHIEAKDVKERDEWIQAIEQCIDKSLGISWK